jgi:hypothetical protein
MLNKFTLKNESAVTNIQVNELRYSTALSFLSVNLFSIPIAFSKSTERKSLHLKMKVLLNNATHLPEYLLIENYIIQ